MTSTRHDVKDLSLAGRRLERKVPLPIDREIARLKLPSVAVRIDDLTTRQQVHLASRTHGT